MTMTMKMTAFSTEASIIYGRPPCHETTLFRDAIFYYSHLPNGIDVLDDKWVLVRLFSNNNKFDGGGGADGNTTGKKTSSSGGGREYFALLKIHCFRGPD